MPPAVRPESVTPTSNKNRISDTACPRPVGVRQSASSARSAQVSDPSIYHRKQSDCRQSSRLPGLSDLPFRFARGARLHLAGHTSSAENRTGAPVSPSASLPFPLPWPNQNARIVAQGCRNDENRLSGKPGLFMPCPPSRKAESTKPTGFDPSALDAAPNLRPPAFPVRELQVFDSRVHVTNSLELLSLLPMRHLAFPHPAPAPQGTDTGHEAASRHIRPATYPDRLSANRQRLPPALALRGRRAVRARCAIHGSAVKTVRSSFTHAIAAVAVVSTPFRA